MSEPTYPPSPSVTLEPPPRPIPELADTGADIAGPIIGGSVLLMLAVAALLVARSWGKR